MDRLAICTTVAALLGLGSSACDGVVEPSSLDLRMGDARTREQISAESVFPINFRDRIFSSDASWLRWEDAKRSCRTSDIQWLQNDRIDEFQPFEYLSIFIENEFPEPIFYQYRNRETLDSVFRFMQVPYTTVQSRSGSNVTFLFGDAGHEDERFGDNQVQLYDSPGCTISISHEASFDRILTYVRAPHGPERAVCVVSTLMISVGFVGFGEAESWSATSYYGDAIQHQSDVPPTSTVFYDQRIGIYTTDSLLCLGSMLSIYNRPDRSLEVMRSDFRRGIACATAPDADLCISAFVFELPIEDRLQ